MASARLSDGRAVALARVRAVPDKGQANRALVDLLAKTLRVPKSAVEVIAGRDGAAEAGAHRRRAADPRWSNRSMATVRLILVFAALAALPVVAEAGNRSVYSDLVLDKCKSLPIDPEDPVANGRWRCKGYGGIDVSSTRATNAPRSPTASSPTTSRRPGRRCRRSIMSARSSNGGSTRKGRPIATILRFITEPDQAPKGSTLVVTRLGPPGSICWVGKVDAVANPDANEIARAVADNFAADFPCGDKEPVDYGVNGEPVERD